MKDADKQKKKDAPEEQPMPDQIPGLGISDAQLEKWLNEQGTRLKPPKFKKGGKE